MGDRRLTPWAVLACAVFAMAHAPGLASAAPRRIAFGYEHNGDSGVYVIDAHGNGVRRVSGGAGLGGLNQTFDPDWSPDATRIAFVGALKGAASTFVVRADGSDLTRLSRSTCYSEFTPKWSPNGRWIAFRHDTCERMALWMMRSDGSRKRNLKLGLAGSPSWSPDSRWLAYARRSMKNDYRSEVFVVRRDGKVATQVSHGQGARSRHFTGNSGPVVSPNGRWIAFIGGDKGERQGICVVRSDGTEERCLTHTEGLEWSPSWSPNGRKLVFGSGHDKNVDIWRIRLNGTRLRRLTGSGRHDGSPVWSPSGTWIAFISKRDGNAELYVMRADGSDERRLTFSPGDEAAPDWEPTSR